MADPRTPSASPQNPPLSLAQRYPDVQDIVREIDAKENNPETPELDLHTDIEKVKKMDTSDWFEENSSAGTVFGDSHHGGVLPSNKAASVPAVQQNPDMEKLLREMAACYVSVWLEDGQGDERQKALKFEEYFFALQARNALLEEDWKMMEHALKVLDRNGISDGIAKDVLSSLKCK